MKYAFQLLYQTTRTARCSGGRRSLARLASPAHPVSVYARDWAPAQTRGSLALRIPSSISSPSPLLPSSPSTLAASGREARRRERRPLRRSPRGIFLCNARSTTPTLRPIKNALRFHFDTSNARHTHFYSEFLIKTQQRKHFASTKSGQNARKRRQKKIKQ